MPVVAGFQGDAENRVTTLGQYGYQRRRPSRCAGADRCDIYTDVDGVYTTDPHIVSRRIGQGNI